MINPIYGWAIRFVLMASGVQPKFAFVYGVKSFEWSVPFMATAKRKTSPSSTTTKSSRQSNVFCCSCHYKCLSSCTTIITTCYCDTFYDDNSRCFASVLFIWWLSIDITTIIKFLLSFKSSPMGIRNWNIQDFIDLE